jgi:hypothetical protein
MGPSPVKSSYRHLGFAGFQHDDNHVSQVLVALDVPELNAGSCMSEIRIEALVIRPGEPGRLKVSTD